MIANKLQELGAKHLVGSSLPMVGLWKELIECAPTAGSVLITGETGTGKELVAREIHERSGRPHGNYVSVNCAELGRDRAESELFGHVRGSFTGAERDRPGLFRSTNGGTLFLDEIGELPLDVQAKLLRAIECGEVRPAGADRSLPVDVRVIAATNRSIPEAVSAGIFRRDLQMRFRFAVELPSLRSRVDDIPLLAHHFIRKHREAAGYNSSAETLTAAAATRLVRHRWPGNVRELESCVCRALARSAATRPVELGEELFLIEAPGGSPLVTARSQAVEAVAALADTLIDAILSGQADAGSPPAIEKAFADVRLREQLVYRFKARFSGTEAMAKLPLVFGVTSMEAINRIIRSAGG
jgi:transcriptional regulator with GAF, ATPase, and Fis domain